MLEEDGRIDEQIFNEYVSLNLRYPPQFIQVSSAIEAMEKLEEENIELTNALYELENRLESKIDNIHPVVYNLLYSNIYTM